MVVTEESAHFSYNGSLPYPPCTQVYKTFVFEKVGRIGSTNIETFKKYLGNSARPIRPKGERNIFYTPYLKKKGSEKKVFRSSNKYLKCYRENVSRRTTDTSPTGSVEPETNVVDTGLSPELISKIGNIFMSIIVLLIFVNAFTSLNISIDTSMCKKVLGFWLKKKRLNIKQSDIGKNVRVKPSNQKIKLK